MEWGVVERRISGAIQDFLARDSYLLEVDANERSISHRLALHLQCRFPEWDVDCEYNRMGDPSSPDAQSNLSKRLDTLYERVSTDDTNAKTVFPDIIVHKRGRAGPNLLVLEMKKSGCGPNAVAKDHEKLRAYLRELTYDYGVFLAIKTGASAGFEGVQRILSN